MNPPYVNLIQKIVPPAVATMALLLSSCGTDLQVDGPHTKKAQSSDRGNAQEREMMAFIRGHSKQKRSQLKWEPRLAKAARAKAQDMGRRGYYSHVDPDGFGPNRLVQKTGYKLPVSWTAFDETNYVESFVAGHATAESAFKSLLGSTLHAQHLLGLSEFTRKETNGAVGYAHVPNSPYGHYWVFLSAPPEE